MLSQAAEAPLPVAGPGGSLREADLQALAEWFADAYIVVPPTDKVRSFHKPMVIPSHHLAVQCFPFRPRFKDT